MLVLPKRLSGLAVKCAASAIAMQMKQTTITYHPPNLVTYSMERKMVGRQGALLID